MSLQNNIKLKKLYKSLKINNLKNDLIFRLISGYKYTPVRVFHKKTCK